MLFELTNEEATQVLNVLAKEPYINVHQLIGKLQKQAGEQTDKQTEQGKGENDD